MQYKIKPLQFISFVTVIAFLGFNSQATFAQKVKIDGVAVVIGKNIVLDSDIDKFKVEFNKNTEGKVTISDCEMLEQLMLQKLIAHHAVIDSVVVSDAEINAGVDNQVNYFKQQYGSEEKMLSAYGFTEISIFKKELFKIDKENKLIQKEQVKITEKIDVTPEEVRLYYKGLKDKNELPEFPAEIEIAQLVINAQPTAEEHKRIIAKLIAIKKQIEDGASFKLKAIVNSDDPGVTKNGGQYEIKKDSPFIKEFKEVAFSLEINEVSEPFKSQFGYHIIQLHAIKGNTRVASHILMQPVISDDKLKEAKEKVLKIKKDIESGTITFKEAVKKFSQDKDTRNSGGLLLNPNTGDAKFDLTRMDPALYARVNDLKKGELTDVYYEENREGEKMYKIILMKERTDTHIAVLVDDYVKVQGLALQKKKQEKIASWSKEKIKDTYIKLNNQHKKCRFDRNWKKEISK